MNGFKNNISIEISKVKYIVIGLINLSKEKLRKLKNKFNQVGKLECTKWNLNIQFRTGYCENDKI